MLKLGTIAFGGPAVHVALLREEAVRQRHWIDDREFLDLFGAVSILPGPSSTQLAIVLSRRRAGLAGLIVGGTCFICPAAILVVLLAWAYVRYGRSPTGGGVLYGIEPVVVSVVVVAVYELARSAVRRRWTILVGAAAVVLYFSGANVLIPLVAGGLVVAVVDNWRSLSGHRAMIPMLPMLPAVAAVRARPGVGAVLGEFAKLGVITFGSGYVLLAFLRADLVTHLHWLTEKQVLDAVAAGQVTPGPVFTTATFVGYVLGGLPLAVVATVGIFVPSFLLVVVLERFITRVRRSRWVAPALEGIALAALGLMAGVAFDLGRTAIRDPLTGFLAAGSLIVMWWRRPNALWLILPAAAVGVAHALV